MALGSDHILVLQSLGRPTRFNPLSTNPTKWSNIPKQFACCCRQIVEFVFKQDHFVGLALIVLRQSLREKKSLFLATTKAFIKSAELPKYVKYCFS